MPDQSRRDRYKASRLPQHQASQYTCNGHAPNHPIQLRSPEMEGNSIKKEPRSSLLASASPPDASAPHPDEDVEMADARESFPPAPIKRPSSERDDNDEEKQGSPKRRRTATPAQDAPCQSTPEVARRSPSPTFEEPITAVPYTEPLFDDEPTHLLKRSIAIALSCVGFNSASKEAMDAFVAEANSCMCIEPVFKRIILTA